MLRLAVTESESWLLADADALAGFLGVANARITPYPDQLDDPKREIISLARRSGKRLMRQEVVSAFDRDKAGAGYNLHLCEFVRGHWDAARAMPQSPSLARAVNRLKALAPQSR